MNRIRIRRVDFDVTPFSVLIFARSLRFFRNNRLILKPELFITSFHLFLVLNRRLDIIRLGSV